MSGNPITFLSWPTSPRQKSRQSPEGTADIRGTSLLGHTKRVKLVPLGGKGHVLLAFRVGVEVFPLLSRDVNIERLDRLEIELTNGQPRSSLVLD